MTCVQIRKNSRKWIVALMAICMLMPLMPTLPVSAADVAPTDKECDLSFQDVDDVFFGNARAVKAKVGTEVYLTYTVKEVKKTNKTTRHGVVMTNQPEEAFPYLDGGYLAYSTDAPLLKEGYTYFFKFAYKEDGVEYVAAAAKGENSQYIVFANSAGKLKDDYTHFGLWLGTGKVSVRLEHVRCYDQNGKNLGVYAPKHKESLLDHATVMQKDTVVDHRYDITIEKGINVALSNAKGSTAETVYMEYTVKSSKTKIYQTGLLNHRAPKASYPHADAGYMVFDAFPSPGDGYLLQAGASYIIKFVRQSDGFLALVQKTYRGSREFYEFTSATGKYTYGDPYFGLWFGEGGNYPVNCELTNFKCYDAKKNNLGVQTNNIGGTTKIVHYGEMEDYSGCEAMYYCRENKGIIALYKDQSAKVTHDSQTEKITYKIKDNVLELKFDKRTDKYEYFYQKFTDEDGNVYRRLGTYYVNFVTGTDDEIPQMIVDAGSGYTIASPDAPNKEGAEFLGWQLSDGSEYDFDSIVDSSLTLYAKWSDEQTFAEAGGFLDGEILHRLIPAGISAVLVAAGAAAGLIILKKGKKNGEDKEKKTS